MTPLRIGNRSVDILYDEARIAGRIHELSQQIARWHADRQNSLATADNDGTEQVLMVIPLLRGSFVFASDLLRAMANDGVHPHIDFLTLSSYGDQTTSSGEVQIYKDIRESVEGRDILLVDDILESGRTLHFAQSLMMERGARQVSSVVLLEKPGKRKVDIQADFTGFSVPDRFVVGYGLDYANRYRELPFIGAIDTA